MRTLFLAAILALSPIVALADARVYETPIVLRSQTKAAEVDVTLSRAAEREPAFFRLLAADARRYATEFAARAESDFKEYGETEFWRPYSLTVDYRDVLVTERFTGVLSTSYEYTGGAHGNSFFEGFLFDNITGGIVGLNDLFAETQDEAPALTAIADFVREDLKRQKTAVFARFGSDTAYDPETDVFLADIRPSLEFLQVFTAEPSTEPARLGGLTFHFGPYIVGSYAEGPYQVTVPQAVFSEFLTGSFKPVFGGEPRIGARLDAIGEAASVVVVDGIEEYGILPRDGVLSGQVPRHWFSQGPVIVRLVDEEGIKAWAAELTIDKALPTDAGFEMAGFSAPITLSAPAGTSGQLVFTSSDRRLLTRGDDQASGPAEAEIEVKVGEATSE